MTDNKYTIVAIHGAGMTGSAWGGMMPHLLDHSFRALSLPGHIADLKDAPLTSIGDMGDWVKTRLERDAPNSNILVGHSMGALVALKAANHPSVAAIVLLGAAPRLAVNVGLLQAAVENTDEAIGAISNWGAYSDHPQIDAIRDILKSMLRAVPAGVLAKDLHACHTFDETESVAAGINKPALVISGDHDKMVRTLNEGQILADMLPQGQFSLMPDCGHMIMIEKPLDTAREIKEFIEGLPPR